MQHARIHPCLAMLCTIALGGWATPAAADMVELTTGRFYECIIVNETETSYDLEMKKRSIRVAKSKVTDVYRWSAGRNAEMRERWVSGWRPAPGPSRGSSTGTGAPQVVTAASFDQMVLRATQPVLVDFWATWCGPCLRQAPILEQMAGEFAGKVTVAKLDIDQHPSVAEKYGVHAYPTLILFQDGRPTEKFVGLQDEARLRALFSRVAS